MKLISDSYSLDGWFEKRDLRSLPSRRNWLCDRTLDHSGKNVGYIPEMIAAFVSTSVHTPTNAKFQVTSGSVKSTSTTLTRRNIDAMQTL